MVLTVRTAIDLNSEPDAAFSVPIQRHDAHVTGNHRVLEVMSNHTVRVDVPRKCLEKEM